MILRELSDLKFPVGADVVCAVETIKALGGRHTHDSGHQEGPTWIYTFRAHQEAQVALRINRDKLSVYVRATPHGRRDFEPALRHWAEVEQTYPNPDEKPANSLMSDGNAAFLTPRRGRLLRLRVLDGQLEPLLKAYLPARSPTVADSTPDDPAIVPTGEAQLHEALDDSRDAVLPIDEGNSNGDSDFDPARQTSPEQLKRALDRNDATGKAGEMLAYQDELIRLEVLGCPDPAAHARLVANENVAAGYDIYSEWNGERRCIEVKTTASGREQIFMTANECDTLRALGSEAWLYRVDLSAGEGGAVVVRLQNPMATLEPDRFRPVVWEVDVRKLRERHE